MVHVEPILPLNLELLHLHRIQTYTQIVQIAFTLSHSFLATSFS